MPLETYSSKAASSRPGESCEVSLDFHLRDLAYFDEDDNTWTLEKGSYLLRLCQFTHISHNFTSYPPIPSVLSASSSWINASIMAFTASFGRSLPSLMRYSSKA